MNVENSTLHVMSGRYSPENGVLNETGYVMSISEFYSNV